MFKFGAGFKAERPSRDFGFISDSRSRMHGLGHTVSDTQSRTLGLGLAFFPGSLDRQPDTRSRTLGLGLINNILSTIRAGAFRHPSRAGEEDHPYETHMCFPRSRTHGLGLAFFRGSLDRQPDTRSRTHGLGLSNNILSTIRAGAFPPSLKDPF